MLENSLAAFRSPDMTLSLPTHEHKEKQELIHAT